MKKKWMQVLTIWLALSVGNAPGGGIPEPGMVFYGSVTNTAFANARITSGALNWTVIGEGNGQVTQQVPVTDLGPGLSYRLRVPFESVVGGNTLSANTFAKKSSTIRYINDANNISLAEGGKLYGVSIVGPAQVSVDLSGETRGVVQRIDLSVNAADIVPPGGSALNPAQSAGTGESGGEDSYPYFNYAAPHPDGGIFLSWNGVIPGRSYLLIRTQNVNAPLQAHEVVHQFEASPAVSNTFRDTNVVNTATYFYKLIFQ